MEVLQKLVITILLLPCVSSSLQEEKSIGNDTISNNSIHQMSHKLLSEITVHAFLLWASMGFLMPVGILLIRMSNTEECGRRLRIIFYAHAISQTIALLLATAGAVLSIKNFNNSFSNHHQKIGVALYGIIWLQALLGILRPRRGSRGRSLWFFAHWVLGTAVSLLGILNIYTGLQAYHEKTSRSISLWTILLTIEISFIVFLYLLQDKWVYMQKQGVIFGNEPRRPHDKEIARRDKPKELTMTETC
ncbi:Cytochrome b561 domain-containing protein [Melia azedarach]|uniref:Cytochrome b561 domain-containing protein n=1 Tax=Melia azedarach TaxID=155640 RepID=A0ACC1YZT5_MELAZ|nr:Cytochrome b561 domain-containing protein [Melia azedarach]